MTRDLSRPINFTNRARCYRGRNDLARRRSIPRGLLPRDARRRNENNRRSICGAEPLRVVCVAIGKPASTKRAPGQRTRYPCSPICIFIMLALRYAVRMQKSKRDSGLLRL